MPLCSRSTADQSLYVRRGLFGGEGLFAQRWGHVFAGAGARLWLWSANRLGKSHGARLVLRLTTDVPHPSEGETFRAWRAKIASARRNVSGFQDPRLAQPAHTRARSSRAHITTSRSMGPGSAAGSKRCSIARWRDTMDAFLTKSPSASDSVSSSRRTGAQSCGLVATAGAALECR